jgi:hypothetical protein
MVVNGQPKIQNPNRKKVYKNELKNYIKKIIYLQIPLENWSSSHDQKNILIAIGKNLNGDKKWARSINND